MIRVLVVEDSAVARELLAHILSSDPEIQIVGTARDGEEAVAAVAQKRPHVITMDSTMPKLNGFEATRRIMETHPTPIVIVSASWDPKEVATTFRALEAGALAVVPRPAGLGHPDYEAGAEEFLKTVKLMSEVKVVRRWPRLMKAPTSPLISKSEPLKTPGEIQVVAIGASTGGPLVLQTILSRLPGDFPAPVLVVQHIAAGFVQGFADWLAHAARLPVRLAAHGDLLQPGQVYIAPDGAHMGVGNGRSLRLSRDDPEGGLRPSVSHLFRSVAQHFGPRAVGVLLSGMGQDGAEALKLMKDQGAITLVQDEESSVVHGMPGMAIQLGAATHVLSPEGIAAALTSLTKKRSEP